MGAPFILPLPIPTRDLFKGKVGQNTDENTGIAMPWIRWFHSIYNALIALSTAVFITSTQAGLATMATPRTGQLVFVSDYNHMLMWTGSGYTWAPGENGSGYISAFLNDPSPTTGWQLCDGTATTKLNSDGTTTPVTTPNYTVPSYLKLATALVAGPTAASGVTGTNSTSVVVAAGVGTTVAANLHTHVPASIELQRTQLKAWYRR